MNTHLRFLTKGLRRSQEAGHPRQISLRSNDHWKVPQQEVLKPIRCLRGIVWITCEGQPEDVVLTAGHEWQPEQSGLTVVGALSDAVVAFGAAA